MLHQPADSPATTDLAGGSRESHADPTLAALIEEHAGKVSDKWSSYIPAYDGLFASRRHAPVRLLEIGVLNGGSLEIWAKYFPAARLILGCDINPACASLAFDDPRVKVVVADASSNKGAQQLFAQADEFDIIIDDGSHHSSDVVRSFFRYFPKLATGGLYVVEDLHCSYWEDFEGGLYHPYSSMAFFKALADVLNRQHWGVSGSASGFLAGFSQRYEAGMDESIFAEIQSVEFRNSLCIVSKRESDKNELGHRVISGFDEAITSGHRAMAGSGPIVSDESGNASSRRSLTAEISIRDKEIEGLRGHVWSLSAEAEKAKAALLRSQAEAAKADAELQRAEAELGRSRDMQSGPAGPGREVVLNEQRFRLGFSINGTPTAPREFARYVPVAEAVKILGRAALYALKRRLRLLKGKSAFKANEPLPGLFDGTVPGLTADAGPTIGIILAFDPAAAGRVASTVRSLSRQSRTNWRLAISATAGGGIAVPVELEPFVANDSRIQWAETDVDGYAAALRAAAEQCEADFLMVLGPGDQLHPETISVVAHTLRTDPGIDILHADEDVGEEKASHSPQLKPEWSPELLTSYNYFGRPTAIRRTRLMEAGSFDDTLGEACEWDLNLRLTAPFAGVVATPQIRRLPLILCHRDTLSGNGRPGPDDPLSQSYRAALKKHWLRQGIDAEIATQPDGTLHAVWPIAEPPLVSVIIPSKNKAGLLRVCLEGLLERTDYPRIEIIVVDNGSTEAETLQLFEEMSARGVHIVDFDQPFNYSRACNRGAAAAGGALLLFLNNDIEVLSPGWLQELVRYALRRGVGVVGTKLVYPDGVLQHAGVVVGVHLCALAFNRGDENAWGPFGSPSVARNWLGVMGACQMVRREVFDRVGGYDEHYRLAQSDIKFTLDAWRAGYRIAYTPFAAVHHHEGATRGHSNPDEDLWRSARDIRALGFDDDPYFHPALDTADPVPVLRSASRPSLPENLRAIVLGLAGPLSERDIVNIYDDAEVAHAAALRPRDILWLPDASDAVPDGWWAARLMIDLLRRRPDLRRRFPTALSDGADGDFAIWLKRAGAAAFRLPEGAAEAIDGAFASDLTATPLQLLFYSEELRARQPLYLLPEGRRETCRYLFSAAAAGELRLEAVWWLLLIAAQDPAARLVQTYQFTPDWQKRFPDGITRFGRDRLAAWLGATFALTHGATEPRKWPQPLSAAEEIAAAWLASKDWQMGFPQALADPAAAESFLSFLAGGETGPGSEASAWVKSLDRPRLAQEMTRPGVNIFGHFSYPSGLRNSALSIAAGLDLAGIRTALRDVRVDQAKDDPVHHRFCQAPLFDISILHIQPEPFFDAYLARSDSAELGRNPYRIGFWYWEFDTVPASWDRAAQSCDELWAASSFVANGLAKRYHKPVKVFLPGLELPKFPPVPRRQFGLPDGPFIFLFAFHMTSVMERKNPLGLVAAFRQAFRAGEEVMLVIKTSFGSASPAELAALNEAAANPRIRFIDAIYSEAEMLALMDASDAYISLHRSEGLGLTMAEAMLLGKPVIATRYSGNLDFMDDRNSLLVDCSLDRLERSYPPYEAGLRWATPSVDHAASLMRRLYEDRPFGRELGARARSDLESRLSHAATGAPMAERLKVIAAGRRRR
jgi:GT2 family glycosyltransferase/glycosyltransferase involved in cell wall biosynthesis